MAFNYKTDPCPHCTKTGFMSPLVGALDSGRIGPLRRRSPSRIGGDGLARGGSGRDGIGINEDFPVPVEAEQDWEESYYCSNCLNVICL